MTSYYHGTGGYYHGPGGTAGPSRLTANLCPLGVENGANGDCDTYISSLPTAWRSAPGSRQQFNAGPIVLQPYQWAQRNATCTAGYGPFNAGTSPSCRPAGGQCAPVLPLTGYAGAALVPYPGALYSYNA